MQTTLKIATYDNVLKLIDKPTTASGAIKSIYLDVVTDIYWDGYTVNATFQREDSEEIYERMLVDGLYEVPHEVIAEKGVVKIGLIGYKEGTKKTSTLIKYNIPEGAKEGTETSKVPTPSVYEQLLDLIYSGAVGGSGNGTSIIIDKELSTTSPNPVQNKVVTSKVLEIETTIGNVNSLLETI